MRGRDIEKFENKLVVLEWDKGAKVGQIAYGIMEVFRRTTKSGRKVAEAAYFFDGHRCGPLYPAENIRSIREVALKGG